MLWSGLKDAQTFDRGTYLNPGDYTLKIVNCLTKQTQKSGEGFIVEFEVLESTNPLHAVGSKCTWFQGLKNVQVSLGAIKEFLAAVYGYPLNRPEYKARFEAEMNPQLEAIAAAASDGRNILAGQIVKVNTTMVTTQQNKPFTRHTWTPYQVRT